MPVITLPVAYNAVPALVGPDGLKSEQTSQLLRWLAVLHNGSDVKTASGNTLTGQTRGRFLAAIECELDARIPTR